MASPQPVHIIACPRSRPGSPRRRHGTVGVPHRRPGRGHRAPGLPRGGRGRHRGAHAGNAGGGRPLEEVHRRDRGGVRPALRDGPGEPDRRSHPRRSRRRPQYRRRQRGGHLGLGATRAATTQPDLGGRTRRHEHAVQQRERQRAWHAGGRAARPGTARAGGPWAALPEGLPPNERFSWAFATSTIASANWFASRGFTSTP